MAENEYLDSRKARRWSAVAEAVRNRRSIDEIGGLVLERTHCDTCEIRGWKTCGVCPACVFRRLALHAGGIDESPENYNIDLLSPLSDRMGPKKLWYLKAFLLLVYQLEELEEDRMPIVLARHLRETGVLGSEMTLQSCLDLYGRYRREWLAFLELARSNGCRWSNLIDLPAKAA